MKEVTCALCPGGDTAVVDHSPAHTVNLGTRTFVRDVTNVVCLRCGLVFNNPQLDPSDLEELYSGMSRAHGPMPSADEAAGSVDEVTREQFAFLVEYAPGQELRGKRVLEVGCSLGYFLRLCAEAGATVDGVEPSSFDAAFAETVNGVRVRRTFYARGTYPPHSFDVANMFYVLEHVPDPIETLAAVHHHLAPGGMLYLEVPDGTRPFVGFDSFFSIGHLFSFSHATLEAFLKRAGFTPIVIESVGGVENTGKDFARLRAIARRSRRSFPTDFPDEAERVFDTMSLYQAERNALIRRVNARLDPLIRAWRLKRARVFVYGAGTHSAELLARTRLGSLPLAGFIDGNPVFQGHRYLGLRVHSPETLEDLGPDAIVISARGWEREIWDRLSPQRARGVEVLALYRSDLG